MTLSTPGPIVTPSPLTSPNAPPALALADSPPFQIEKCKTPFKQADPTGANWPDRMRDFPDLGDGQISGVSYLLRSTAMAISLIRPLGSTGYAPVDLAILRYARMAAYAGAISYCRRVPGVETIIVDV